MSLVIAILCIFFFAVVLLLVVLNQGTVGVNLLFRTYEEVPVRVVMVASLLAGIGFTSFIGIIEGIRLRVRNRRLRREVARLEREMELLRQSYGPSKATDGPSSDSTPPPGSSR